MDLQPTTHPNILLNYSGTCTSLIRWILCAVWSTSIFRSISVEVQQIHLDQYSISRRWPSLHRWLGRAYLIGQLLSLSTAAALLPYEHAHPEHFGNAQVVLPVGLTLLATILTALMGYIRIRQRQYLRALSPCRAEISIQSLTHLPQVTACG